MKVFGGDLLNPTFDRSPMIEKIAPYWKAVVGFLTPGILILCAPLLAGRLPTGAEVLVAVGTALSTGLGVYAATNKKKEPEEDSDYEPQRAVEDEEA